jgi:ferritin-like metal-binding protein YciE
MNPAEHLDNLIHRTKALVDNYHETLKRAERAEARLKKASESLNGEVDRRIMMEKKIAELLPPPADGDNQIQFERLLARLRMATEIESTHDQIHAVNERLEHALNAARLEKDAWESQANNHYIESRNWRERYEKEVFKNGELIRENETLARNVPPEPPVSDPIFWNPYNCAVQDHRDGTIIQPDTDKERAKRGLPPLAAEPPVPIGQQWCRCNNENDVPEDAIGDRRRGGWMVLCNAYQDVRTGSLTYVPVRVIDLPEISGV